MSLILISGLGMPVLGQSELFESSPEFPKQQRIQDTAAITLQIKNASRIVESHPDSAFHLVIQGLQSALALNYKMGVIQGFFELGLLYHLKGDQQKSIQALKSALPYCDNNKAGHTLIVKLYTGIAYRYSFMDKNDSAAVYYYKALDDVERWKIDNPEVLINTYYKMVLLWLSMNEGIQGVPEKDKYIETALSYLNKAERLEKKNDKMLSKILLSKAHISYLQRQFGVARHGYYEYLDLAKKGRMDLQASLINSVYINVSETFLVEEKADSALYYASLAIEKIEKEGRKDSLQWINALYNSGKALCIQNKYKEAVSITLTALKIAQRLPLPNRFRGHQILSEAYGSMGDYRAAWQHQQAYSLIRDSIKSQENIRSISQMEVKYQVAERNKELAEKEMSLVKKDNSIKTKNMWIGGIFAGLLLVMLVSILLYRQKDHKQRIHLLQLQQEKEVSLLHAMIDGEEKERTRLAGELHDGIGGLLGTIRMQLGAALRNHPPQSGAEVFRQILHLLDDAYGELRKTAHNLMPEILQQEGLEIATGIFCDRVRKADSLEINYETVGDIPRLKPGLELALYRIIQELLHNVLKHAQASEALVQLAFIDSRLGITVEDNGIGMPGITGNGEGMGMKTIQDRIRRMGGKFDITSAAGEGSSINLEFLITAKERLN